MIPLFPFEILTKIGRLLSKQDQAECTHVCRAWKIPFQESMWNTIEILSDAKLDQICSSTTNGMPYHKNGHLVRTLFLEKWLKAEDRQLFTVQKRFQKINRLYIREKSVINRYFNNMADWSRWKSLTHMEICISGLYLENESRDFLKILECLPNLRWLECPQRYGYAWPYTLEEFDTIHSCIPKIEYLSLVLDLAPITEKHKTIIAETQPTSYLKVIKLRMNKVDLRWLRYFAHKYPNAHTIEWHSDIRSDTSNVFREEAISMFSTLSCAFQHLENILIDGTSGREWWYITFLDLLCHFKTTKAKRIEYRMRYGHSNLDLEKRIIHQCAQTCPTVMSLNFISSDLDLPDPTMIPVTIDFCPSILDLRIDALSLPIAVDILLDKCPSLKRLRLAVKSLSISKEATGTHGLRLIEFVGSKICTNVFSYLSFRCRCLNYLRLTKMEVVGPMFQGGCVCLDMSYTHLEYLQLTCVTVSASDGDDFNVSTVINLIALDQLNRVPQQDSVIKAALATKDIYPVFSKLLPWAHMYCIWDGGYEMIKLRKLVSEEAAYVQSYYQSFEQNKETYGSAHSFKRRRSYLGQLDQEHWKEDLDRGFVLFRCGSVRNYFIDTLGYYDDEFWEKLQTKFM
ncbi:hypothetical protein F4703DRAFT_1924160 [Phycomyces blakesleeanus]